MKQRHSLFLVSILIFFASATAKAQPPEAAPIEYPSQHFLNNTISDFYRSFNIRNGNFVSMNVEGQKPDNEALGEICHLIAARLGNFNVGSTGATYQINPQNPNLITVNFTLKFDDYGLNFHIAQADSVELKRYASNNATQWLIVPGDPQKYFDTPIIDLHAKANQPISGITENIATLVAFPEELLPAVHLHQSMVQLKAIGLAMMYFLQDYDEHLDFTPQNFREKLKGYTRNESVFTAPGDPAGTTSYDVNANVVGLSLADFTSPSETVAFYLGHDQKLDFRYDGLSAVCFMDGHVKAVSPEQAKNLRWEP